MHMFNVHSSSDRARLCYTIQLFVNAEIQNYGSDSSIFFLAYLCSYNGLRWPQFHFSFERVLMIVLGHQINNSKRNRKPLARSIAWETVRSGLRFWARMCVHVCWCFLQFSFAVACTGRWMLPNDLPLHIESRVLFFCREICKWSIVDIWLFKKT